MEQLINNEIDNNKLNENNFILTVQEKLEELKKPEDFFEFIAFKEDINKIITNIFSKDLEWKGDSFVRSFVVSNKDNFNGDEKQAKELTKLILKKNKIYNNILLFLIKLWKLDKLLSIEQIEDIENVIKSWILWYFTDVFLEYEKLAKDHSKTNNLPAKPKQLSYGAIKEWEYVSYSDVLWYSNINQSYFNKINNDNIRKYLLLIKNFLDNKNTSYQDWVDAEVLEMNSWKDKNSSLGFIAPMEDYILSERCVEPEIIILLKDINIDTDSNSYSNFSEKYFDSWYDMDKVILNFVEPILEWWDAVFSWFIWKAFPNDIDLSKKEWNAIILKLASMEAVIDNSEKWMYSLLWKDFNYNKSILKKELIKEVSYHEYWHSLFIKWHPSSQLEELKATLFYYLKIYDENFEKEYSHNDIRKIVEFTIMDSIRTIQRKEKAPFQKYVILTKVILYHLFRNNLVMWKWDKLCINIDNLWFSWFLNSLKNELNFIKKLYSLDSNNREKKENDYLWFIDEKISLDIEKIYKIVS